MIRVSVIIPAWNAEKTLPICLNAIHNSTNVPHEIIVVDDQSDDFTAEIARSNGAKLLRADARTGPGGARNLGASVATGDVLLFLDADVVAQPDTISIVAAHFLARPDSAAVFGTYDDEPAERNFLSQYKNLQHHYVHQVASVTAATFWAGCGAIRRNVFVELGGFDARKYPTPSIEDIELGYRINQAGHSILLNKELRVKHLKKWTLKSHIRTEIFNRAVPWSRLIVESRETIRDLNLTISHRISAVLSWLLVVSLFLIPFYLVSLVSVTLSFLAILVLNRGLYGFFLRHRGLGFLLKAIPMHLIHYLYSSGAFAYCWFARFFGGSRHSVKNTPANSRS